MKTKEQILRAVRKHMDFDLYGTGPEIGNDITLLLAYSFTKGYYISNTDLMAISYMAGQSNLKTLFNEKSLRKAIKKYDKTDAVDLLDTVGEVFHDLLGYKF